MAAKPIPERNPVSDRFTGVVLQMGEDQVLAHAPLPGTQVILDGVLIVRYAVRYLGQPLSIVPGLVALDYGDMLTGEAAWTFLLKHSNLHPRADVLGYRSDGQDDMVVVKKLDLAQPVEVLVYADTQATIPLARPVALITADTANVPQRILDYLPRYDSIADWQAAIHE
jgi:hypothetical protein